MNPEESVSGSQRNSTVLLISVRPRYPQLMESCIYGNVHTRAPLRCVKWI